MMECIMSAMLKSSKLLCAAAHAYAITGNGPVPGCLPFSDMVGYTDLPIGIVGGVDSIDACLIGLTDAELVIALRGTLPPTSPNHLQTILDWKNDADADMVDIPWLPGTKGHDGLLASLEHLWFHIIATVRQYITAHNIQSIAITGHSKGGTLANFCALRLQLEFDDMGIQIPIHVETFAAARGGDTHFSHIYEQRISCLRYEYDVDIVPHIPSSEIASIINKLDDDIECIEIKDIPEYKPVGELRYITTDSLIMNYNTDYMMHLIHDIVTLRFDKIIQAHSIDVGSGYYNAIVVQTV